MSRTLQSFIKNKSRKLNFPSGGKVLMAMLHEDQSTCLNCTFIYYNHLHAQRDTPTTVHTRVGTLILATIYLQLIQNRYMFRSLTVLQCSHQHCVQPVASDVEVVGYL